MTKEEIIKPFIKRSKWISPSEMVMVGDALNCMEQYATFTSATIENLASEVVQLDAMNKVLLDAKLELQVELTRLKEENKELLHNLTITEAAFERLSDENSMLLERINNG